MYLLLKSDFNLSDEEKGPITPNHIPPCYWKLFDVDFWTQLCDQEDTIRRPDLGENYFEVISIPNLSRFTIVFKMEYNGGYRTRRSSSFPTKYLYRSGNRWETLLIDLPSRVQDKIATIPDCFWLLDKNTDAAFLFVKRSCNLVPSLKEYLRVHNFLANRLTHKACLFANMRAFDESGEVWLPTSEECRLWLRPRINLTYLIRPGYDMEDIQIPIYNK